MPGAPDHNRQRAKPFRIAQAEGGDWRLFRCETRFNHQNYPIVTETEVDESFRTSTAARAYARDHFGAEAGDILVKTVSAA